MLIPALLGKFTNWRSNMRVYTRMHYKALTDLVEFMAILSTAAIAIDLYWCVSDYVEQNYAARLVPMIVGLFLTLVGMCFAISKYHWKLVSQYCKDLRLEKVLRKHRGVK